MSAKVTILYDEFENDAFKITVTSPGGNELNIPHYNLIVFIKICRHVPAQVQVHLWLCGPGNIPVNLCLWHGC